MKLKLSERPEACPSLSDKRLFVCFCLVAFFNLSTILRLHASACVSAPLSAFVAFPCSCSLCIFASDRLRSIDQNLVKTETPQVGDTSSPGDTGTRHRAPGGHALRRPGHLPQPYHEPPRVPVAYDGG